MATYRKGLFLVSIRPLFQIAIILSVLCLAACLGHVRHSKPVLPRPEPGHLGWLAAQSMLHQATAYVDQVSQTELLWLNGGRADRLEILLDAAPNWFLEELFSENRSPVKFRDLEAKLKELQGFGFDGLFLGEISDPQEIFLSSSQTNSDGVFSASLELNPALGTQAQFDSFTETAEKTGFQLGADLPGIATTRGPDFILQARHATGFQGIYAMLPVPEKFWQFLPKLSQEWDYKELSEENIRLLAAEGVIPPAMHRDKFTGYPAAGWAATGKIAGADGNLRRWVYRFDKRPDYPVLLWQDPGGLARKILSASVIARTGICGITLAGLRISPLLGLERASDEAGSTPDLASVYSPALDALGDLASQVRRYGGWSILVDSVEEKVLRQSLLANCDFCRDDVSEALFRLAWLTQKPGSLASLLEERKNLKIETRRLARGLNHKEKFAQFLFATLKDAKSEYENFIKLANAQQFANDALWHWNIGLPGLVFSASLFNGKNAGKAESSDTAYEKYATLLKMRKQFKLASGAIDAVFQSPDALAVLSRLPGGNAWLVAVNFNLKPAKLAFRLNAFLPAARDALTGQAEAKRLETDGKSGFIYLDGREVRNIIFHK